MTQNIDPEDLRVRFAAATTALRGTAYRTAPAADEPTMRVIADIAEKFAHHAIACSFGGGAQAPTLTAPSAPTDSDIVLLEWIRWAACRIYDAERELEVVKKKVEDLLVAAKAQSEMHNSTATELWRARDALASAKTDLGDANGQIARDANEKAVLSKRLELALDSMAARSALGPTIASDPEVPLLRERLSSIEMAIANMAAGKAGKKVRPVDKRRRTRK